MGQTIGSWPSRSRRGGTRPTQPAEAEETGGVLVRRERTFDGKPRKVTERTAAQAAQERWRPAWKAVAGTKRTGWL